MTLPKLSKMHKHVLAAKDERELKDLLDGTKESQQNNFWDEANATYHEMREGFRTTMSSIGAMVMAYAKSPEARPEVNLRLKVLIDQLAIDNGRFVNEIDAVYALHKDKSGATQGYDDHRLLLQINERYTQAISLMGAAAGALIDEINELTGVKQAAIEEVQAAQQQALADPSVVSDATIVETAKNEG